MVKVRIGTPEDLDGMMALALAACNENGLTDPNPVKLLEQIWPSLHQDKGIVGAIGPVGGKLEAAILLRTEPLWYSDKLSLVERAVFVDPEYRNAKGGRAARLIEFAKTASESLDMPLVIGILSSQRAASKVKLYERHFGPPSGAYWLWHGKTGEWANAAE
jgi:hypothetical protein